MNWITFSNPSPEMTYFNINHLTQLNVRVTDYEGLDLQLHGGDFKIEFILS